MLSLKNLLWLAGFAAASTQVHDASFTPDHVLVATYEPETIACNIRDSVLINGTSPGPTLYMKEGRTTWIRVWNKIPDQNFTIHWHGLSQRTAPFSDGTPLVAQWPIPPGHFFDYEVRPGKGDAGTYFYHSHVGFQQVSAHGALIVDDHHDEPAYDYDEDVVLTLGNYFAQNDTVIVDGLDASPFVWSGEALAVTVNGQSGNASLGSSDDSCAPHVIEIAPEQKLRLRVIGACVLTTVKMAIEDHQNLTVIEADGQYTEPAEIDHIQVSPGQRFSYILQGMTSDELQQMGKTDFWIRYESRDRPTVTSGYALLRYTSGSSGNSGDFDGESPSYGNGDNCDAGYSSDCDSDDEDCSNDSDDNNADTGSDYDSSSGSSSDDGTVIGPSYLSLPTTSPVVVPLTTYDYLESVLSPLSEKSIYQFPRAWEVTRTVTLSMQQVSSFGVTSSGGFNGSVSWVANEHSWEDGGPAMGFRTPYLVDMYQNGYEPDFYSAVTDQGFDASTQTFPARVGEVIDIVWINNAGIHGGYDSHPMHMHGEHYWDLGGGNGTYDKWANDHKFDSYHPAKRDTTSLYRYSSTGVPYTEAGWRAWRIRVTEDNIGAWMAHCHVAQHAVMGMNTVWIFGTATDLQTKFPDLPYVQGYLNYGGDAYGNDERDPVVNHFFAMDG